MKAGTDEARFCQFDSPGKFGILRMVDFDGVTARLLNEFCKIAG